MGCQLSKEQIPEKEEEGLLNRLVEERENPKETTPIKPTESISGPKRKVPTKSPWNILQTMKPGITTISRETIKEDCWLRQELINTIQENSPPEFGFTRVLKTLVTEGGFTPEALKNIIVLSRGTKDLQMHIRVYSVSSESINFVFHNLIQKIDLNTWDQFEGNYCWFELKHLELKICELDKMLYSIKLDKEGTRPKEIKSSNLKAQAQWTRKIASPLDYNHLHHNRVKNAVYWSKTCFFNDLFFKKTQEIQLRTELKKKGVKTRHLSFAIGDIMKNPNISQDVLRPILLFNANIPALVVNRTRALNNNYYFISIPEDTNEMLYDIDEAQVQLVKKGVISLTHLCKSGFVYFALVNIHQKKVIVQYLVTFLGMILAYCKQNKLDSSVLDPSEVTEENSEEFFQWVHDNLPITEARFVLSSKTFLLKLKADGLYAVADPIKEDLGERFKFFKMSKNQFKLLSPSSSEPALSNEPLGDLLQLPPCNIGVISSWYDQVANKKDELGGSWEEMNFIVVPLKSKCCDLTDPKELENPKVLIVNNKEAVILKERGRRMIDEISFKYELKEPEDGSIKKVRKLGGFCENLVMNNSLLGFTIFGLKDNKNGTKSILKVKKINILSLAINGGEDFREFHSNPHTCTYSFKSPDGSILVLLRLYFSYWTDYCLAKLELDGESFEIKDFKHKVFAQRALQIVNIWVISDFLLTYVAEDSKNEEEGDYLTQHRNKEYQLLNYDLEVLDTIKIPLHKDPIGDSRGFVDSVVTVDNVAGRFVIKKWGVSAKKKKFKLLKSRVFNNVRLRGLSINKKGICLFRVVPVDKKKFGKEVGVQESVKVSRVKLYSFNLNFEIGMVVDLGIMDESQKISGDYVNKKKVYVFKDSHCYNPWFSLTYTDSLRESPVVERFKYKDRN